jgi:hypothetical protein
MRAMKSLIAVGLICLCCQLARADSPDPAHTTVMPNIDVSNQPVDKVLDQLRASVPWFHYVIFRQPGTPRDEPRLPQMSMDGVTVEQFLKLITDEYPAIVSIRRIDGDKTPLYEVNIADPSKIAGKESESSHDASATQPVMKVFALADLVDSLNVSDNSKKAMDDILSLVQAALDASGTDAKNPTVLKVHQPTQTLIFKGTPEKLAVLSQALDALRPKLDSETVKLRSELEECHHRIERLTADLGQKDDELQRTRRAYEGIQMQLITAQAQLEVARKQGVATQPSK